MLRRRRRRRRCHRLGVRSTCILLWLGDCVQRTTLGLYTHEVTDFLGAYAFEVFNVARVGLETFPLCRVTAASM